MEPKEVKPGSLTNTVDNYVAGKLAKSKAKWASLTSDSWVHQVLNGNLLELNEIPEHFPGPHSIGFSKKDEKALDKAVSQFLHHKIIEHCPESSKPSYYSAIFPRPKRDGSVRVIINLRELNQMVDNHHFKMDTVRDVMLLIQKGAWFATIDFKDAFYSVPLSPDSRRYFSFLWKGVTYQFTCMPQGLASAPRIFTKLLKPALAHLRSLGFSVICYIDDCILVSRDKCHLEKGVKAALSLFDSLGLTINLKKSFLKPTSCIEYLGVILDSKAMTVTLTQNKKDKIKSLASDLLNSKSVSIRQLAAFIGNLVAADVSVTNGPLHYKDLEIARNNALAKNCGNYQATMVLDANLKNDIAWWLNNISSQFRDIITPDPDMHVYSDACLTGWGGKCGNITTGGHWAHGDDSHINVLELKAAVLTLKSLCRNVENKHIRLHMDNTSAVACVNKKGSTKQPLLSVTKELFTWAEENSVILSACHIPGKDNVDADRESRLSNLDAEWMLAPNIFKKLCACFGSPEIDLFASTLNAQLSVYASWKPDPNASFIDSFMLSWNDYYSYAFPPFSVIGRTLQKIEVDQADTLVVVPLWPTRPWFSQALAMLTAPPVLLPKHVLQLPQDLTIPHPLSNKLTLVAMPLSGKALPQRIYRQTLQLSCWKDGEILPNNNMGVISKDGCLFHSLDHIVHFRHL